MTTAVYVLSDPLNESIGRYKVGSHTGTCKKLERRYLTYLPELKIHYFLETEKALDVESMMKRIYAEKRLINTKGNRSEWFVMPLNDIIAAIIYLNNTDIQVDERLKIYRERVYYVDKDYTFTVTYEQVKRISEKRMNKIVEKHKEEKLNEKETFQVDKWFFHDIIIDGLDESIYKELYSLWIQNRIIFIIYGGRRIVKNIH